MNRLVSTQDTYDGEESDDVISAVDDYMKLISALTDLRVPGNSRGDSKPEKEALNILSKAFAAACVVNVRVVADSVREVHTAVSCPEMLCKKTAIPTSDWVKTFALALSA